MHTTLNRQQTAHANGADKFSWKRKRSKNRQTEQKHKRVRQEKFMTVEGSTIEGEDRRYVLCDARTGSSKDCV